MLTRLLAYLQKLKYLLKRIDSNLLRLTHLRLPMLIGSNLLKRIRWSLPMQTDLHLLILTDLRLLRLIDLS